MPRDTRQVATRTYVRDYLKKATIRLDKALSELHTVHELLQEAQKALGEAQTAKRLSDSAPEGYRPLPKGIRTKTAKAVATLEKLIQVIEAYPVTRDERAIKKSKKKLA